MSDEHSCRINALLSMTAARAQGANSSSDAQGQRGTLERTPVTTPLYPLAPPSQLLVGIGPSQGLHVGIMNLMPSSHTVPVTLRVGNTLWSLSALSQAAVVPQKACQSLR